MEDIRTVRHEKAQKKYRKKQANKGLVRYEMQIPKESKERFEQMVKAVAEEYEKPWDERQRMAAARAEVFNEMARDSMHEFSELQRQIKALQEEVQALAPKFFAQSNANTPLPSAIRALPDNPEHLKILLAKFFSEGQQAKRQAKEYKRRADQYEELYRVATDQNEKLEIQLGMKNRELGL